MGAVGDPVPDVVHSEPKTLENFGQPHANEDTGKQRNHNNYCEFHRDHSHDTDNCIDLDNHIEDLIKHGYLGGFVDKSEKPAQEESRIENVRPPPRAPPASVIHVISGGIVARGESSLGRKKYTHLCEIDNQGQKKRQDDPVTFTDDDLQGVQTPHNDALVITTKVANFEVWRILVDTGSCVDVLFEEAFEKLGIDKDHLTPVNTPLMGFSGESLMLTRRITLPLLIGDGDITATTMVDFFIVCCSSSYNAILDRPTLNSL
ncbi:PREDICTED: uncharacterized protein LOC104613068 [Nelumbo nucifera]|uniref:Uncharacterized protein LOC104613068 n=1 Tax=Nelumbo nucifera TaxID=4432 RepID=A0A1U8BNP3_NELNU|nr:PREDICTED: uncharacterized protein LOC104613068 [Nelumbo nucifera]